MAKITYQKPIKYALERKQEKRVQISKAKKGDHYLIKFDGLEVGIILKEEFAQGKNFILPDGTNLEVMIDEKDGNEIYLQRNGEPIPESAGDLIRLLRESSKDIIKTGVGNLLFGVIFFAYALQAYYLFICAVSIGIIIVGIMIRKKSEVALSIGLFLSYSFAVGAIFRIAQSYIADPIAFEIPKAELLSSIASFFVNYALFKKTRNALEQYNHKKQLRIITI